MSDAGALTETEAAAIVQAVEAGADAIAVPAELLTEPEGPAAAAPPKTLYARIATMGMGEKIKLALRVHRDEQTKEFVVSGTGQLHLEVVVERLKRKFGAQVELKAPKVPYKETIRGAAKAQGKHKRQTGGHGQYGDA